MEHQQIITIDSDTESITSTDSVQIVGVGDVDNTQAIRQQGNHRGRSFCSDSVISISSDDDEQVQQVKRLHHEAGNRPPSVQLVEEVVPPPSVQSVNDNDILRSCKQELDLESDELCNRPGNHVLVEKKRDVNRLVSNNGNQCNESELGSIEDDDDDVVCLEECLGVCRLSDNEDKEVMIITINDELIPQSMSEESKMDSSSHVIRPFLDAEDPEFRGQHEHHPESSVLDPDESSNGNIDLVSSNAQRSESAKPLKNSLCLGPPKENADGDESLDHADALTCEQSLIETDDCRSNEADKRSNEDEETKFSFTPIQDEAATTFSENRVSDFLASPSASSSVTTLEEVDDTSTAFSGNSASTSTTSPSSSYSMTTLEDVTTALSFSSGSTPSNSPTPSCSTTSLEEVTPACFGNSDSTRTKSPCLPSSVETYKVCIPKPDLSNHTEEEKRKFHEYMVFRMKQLAPHYENYPPFPPGNSASKVVMERDKDGKLNQAFRDKDQASIPDCLHSCASLPPVQSTAGDPQPYTSKQDCKQPVSKLSMSMLMEISAKLTKQIEDKKQKEAREKKERRESIAAANRLDNEQNRKRTRLSGGYIQKVDYYKAIRSPVSSPPEVSTRRTPSRSTSSNMNSQSELGDTTDASTSTNMSPNASLAESSVTNESFVQALDLTPIRSEVADESKPGPSREATAVVKVATPDVNQDNQQHSNQVSQATPAMKNKNLKKRKLYKSIQSPSSSRVTTNVEGPCSGRDGNRMNSPGWVTADEWQVESVVTSKIERGKDGSERFMYRVKWREWDVIHNSWIDEEDFCSKAPVTVFWRRFLKRIRNLNTPIKHVAPEQNPPTRTYFF